MSRAACWLSRGFDVDRAEDLDPLQGEYGTGKTAYAMLERRPRRCAPAGPSHWARVVRLPTISLVEPTSEPALTTRWTIHVSLCATRV